MAPPSSGQAPLGQLNAEAAPAPSTPTRRVPAATSPAGQGVQGRRPPSTAARIPRVQLKFASDIITISSSSSSDEEPAASAPRSSRRKSSSALGTSQSPCRPRPLKEQVVEIDSSDEEFTVAPARASRLASEKSPRPKRRTTATKNPSASKASSTATSSGTHEMQGPSHVLAPIQPNAFSDCQASLRTPQSSRTAQTSEAGSSRHAGTAASGSALPLVLAPPPSQTSTRSPRDTLAQPSSELMAALGWALPSPYGPAPQELALPGHPDHSFPSLEGQEHPNPRQAGSNFQVQALPHHRIVVSSPCTQALPGSHGNATAPGPGSDGNSVCIGVAEIDIVALRGLPPQVLYTPSGRQKGVPDRRLTAEQQRTEAAHEDMQLQTSPVQWEGISAFWARRGTRPAFMHPPEPGTGSGSALQLAIQRERLVSLVIPKRYRPWPPGPVRASREGLDLSSPWYRAMNNSDPPCWTPFAAVADTHAVVVHTLVEKFAASFECSVPMARRARQSVTSHKVHLLIFVPHEQRAAVGGYLRSQNIELYSPEAYDPKDYPGQPALVNPHTVLRQESGFGVNMPFVRRTPGDPWAMRALGVLEGPGMRLEITSAQTPASAERFGDQTRGMTDADKRAKVDNAYMSLQHNEDMPEVQPCALIKSRLFPHQRKALGFLLMREKERSFDSVAQKLHVRDLARRAGKDVPPTEAEAEVDEEGLGLTAEDKAQDGGTLSLWKPVINRAGRIIRYHNVVTQEDQIQRPNLCRGAILADDMGLGKTISIIALLAHTREAALAWSQTRPVGNAGQSGISTVTSSHLGGRLNARTTAYLLDSDSSDSDPISSDDIFLSKGPLVKRRLTGLTRSPTEAAPPKPPGLTRPKPVPRPRLVDTSKMTRKERIAYQEQVRVDHLEVRSRATLIICPMSVISNWQDQIEEHWGSVHRPQVLVYHGPSRLKDVRKIAEYDVVLTTFATIASEFSNQTIWRDYTVRLSKDVDGEIIESDESASEGDQPGHDAEGNSTGTMGRGGFERKYRKRKRTRPKARSGEPHPNPLQRIEWFRVVLDEAHVIKDCMTWQSRAVCNLSAQRRTALTGTLIQNAPSDLYALVRFLRLEPFSDRAKWNYWCNVSKAGLTLAGARTFNTKIDTVAFRRVQTIVKFLTLRRSKQTKGPDGKPILTLPPRHSEVTRLYFSNAEKAKYIALHDRFRDDFIEMAAAQNKGGGGQSPAEILKEITCLRLTCDHIDMVDDGVDIKSSDLTPGELIQSKGMSRARALRYFFELRSEEKNVCTRCHRYLNLGLDAAEAELQDPYGLAERDEPDPNSVRLPVLTKCLHLWCDNCWDVDPCGGPTSSSHDRTCCPECDYELDINLDVVTLLRTDFDVLDNDIDLPSLPSSPGRRAWEQRNDDDEDYFGYTKPGEQVDIGLRSQAQQLRSTAMSRTLEDRPDLSTKILALLQDLLQFSAGNPASKLYDPHAPKLDHIPTPPEQLAMLEREREKQIAASMAAQEEAIREAKQRLRQLQGRRSRQQGPDLHDLSLLRMAADRTVSREQAEAEVPAIPTVQLGVWTPSHPGAEYRPLKSVVFSQWTRMLGKVRKAIERAGIRTVQLDGTLSRDERVAVLDAFRRDDSVEVLLVSLKSGGVGLNLASSSARAYLLDPAWNPAVEAQALDRIYRLGQMRPVVTIKYIMHHSIEENLLLLQARKNELIKSIGAKRDPRRERRMDRRDLQQLFGTTDLLRMENYGTQQ